MSLLEYEMKNFFKRKAEEGRLIEQVTKEFGLMNIDDIHRYDSILVRLKICGGFYYAYQKHYYGF